MEDKIFKFKFKNFQSVSKEDLVVENPQVGTLKVGQLVLVGANYKYRDGLHPNMEPYRHTQYKDYNEFYLGELAFAELKVSIGRKEEWKKDTKARLEEVRKIAERGSRIPEPQPEDQHPRK